MAPPVFDSSTIYKFANVAYNKMYVNALDAFPSGPIVVYPAETDEYQGWYIHTDNGTVTLERSQYPGFYASVREETDSVPLTGFTTPTKWKLVFVGFNTYQITTEDEQFVWVPSRNASWTPIWLKSAASYVGNNASYWTIVQG